MVSREELKSITSFLGEIATVISDIGYANMALKEEAVLLDKEISERKKAEEALKITKDKYLDLFENANDMIFILDLGGNFTPVNNTTSRILKFTKEEMVGKNIRDMLTPESFRTAFELIQKAAMLKSDMKELQPWELEIVTKKGDKLLIEVQARLIWENKQIIGVHGIARDITDRKQAEDEIKRSVSLLHSSLESTADGILVVNREGKMVKFNQKFVDMWKIPAAIVKSGDDDEALAFVLDQLKDPDSFIAKVKELYEKPEEVSHDVIEFKDGRYFERYSQPQEIEGEIIGRVWSFRDVTKRREAENALKQNEQELKQRLKELEDFYDIAVGRELRMIELKQEIHALKEKLKQYEN